MKYHNLHQAARKIVAEEGVGQVSSVRLQFTCWYPDIQGAWRQKKALGGGGAIMDLGVHCFELAEYLLDEKIVKTKSFYDTRTFSYEVEDSAVVAFKTQSGVLGYVDVSFNVPDKASNSKLEIYGTKGNLYLKQINHFTDLIKKGKMDYFYAEKAVNIQEVVDGIYAGK